MNLKGENRFPGSVAHFLPAGISDRSPMVVKLAEMPRVKKAFRFFDFWAECSDFLPLVKEVWRTEVKKFMIVLVYLFFDNSFGLFLVYCQLCFVGL